MAHRADYPVVYILHDPRPVDHLGESALPHAEEFVGTIYYKGYHLIRESPNRVVEGESQLAGHRPQYLELAGVADTAQRDYPPVGYGDTPVGDDAVHIDVRHGAKALAVRAVALRRIEGEGMWRRFAERDAGVGVDQMPGIMVQAPVLHIQHGERAFAQGKGRLHGTAYASPVPVLRLELVHDKFDEMGLVAVQGVDIGERGYLGVYAHLGIALLAQLLEELLVAALAPVDKRGEQQALPAVVFLQYQIHYALVGVSDHLPPGGGREGRGRSGEEKAQEVGDFRDGPHGGARIAPGGLLLYRDDGTESAYALHGRLLEYPHKVPGIGREGVHIAPPAFGADGVEGEGGLAAAAYPGDYHQLAPRDVHIDILEVVGAGSAYFYEGFFIHKNPRIYEIIVSLARKITCSFSIIT